MKLGLPTTPDKPPAAWTDAEAREFLADLRRLRGLSPAYQAGRHIEELMAELLERYLSERGGP